ncbi:hypothetical protein ACIG0C_07765 [Kitasatospora aureofaciens]|uniref:hypothetical protein n=1 Tax=Kitasatospora aureofaciens TaxID=1894 RepID=UPI000A7A5E61|nr:hypothetical protein [Kitasatospora aureofaciens]UKZ04876.1 hypothetical protein BOQ63_012625 [Streptomyces viridifaciens]
MATSSGVVQQVVGEVLDGRIGPREAAVLARGAGGGRARLGWGRGPSRARG